MKISPLIFTAITTIVFFASACKHKKGKQIEFAVEEEPAVEKQMDLKLNSTQRILPDSFILSWEGFSLDSMHTYGAGDCWGKIIHYSYNDIIVAVDSSTCSEYGFEHTYYLFDNYSLQLAYIQESTTIIGTNGEDTTYELRELVYDFRDTLFKYTYRVDAVSDPDFLLMKSSFQNESPADSITIKEKLVLEYYTTWAREESF